MNEVTKVTATLSDSGNCVQYARAMASKTSLNIKHLAKLSNLALSNEESGKLEKQFGETLNVVDELKQLDITSIEATPQVTAIQNCLREDVVDKKRMFSQEDALANAKSHHQGFFMVPAVFGDQT